MKHHAPAAPQLRVGSVSWGVGLFITQLRNWRPTIQSTLAFIASACLVVFFIQIFRLPGGVLPAIPVLTLTLVPHSIFLLLQRCLIVITTMLGSYVVLMFMQQEPLLLAAMAMCLVYVGLYLVARGMDLLTYLLGISMPVLLAWQSANGELTREGIWLDLEQLLLGLLSTGIIGVIFLRPMGRGNLVKKLTTPMLQVAEVLRKPLAHDPADQPKVSVTELTTIERLLGRIRQEHGHSDRTRNLHIVADTTRMLVLWNEIRSMIHEMELTEDDYAFLNTAAMDFRTRMAAQLEENAQALVEDRRAEVIPGIHQAQLELERSTRAAIESREVRRSGDEIALFHAISTLAAMGSRLLAPMTRSVDPHWHEPPGDLPFEGDKHRKPWAGLKLLGESFSGRDPWATLFALKGVIVGVIAFGFTSMISDWHGAIVMLLMSLLLTTQNMGAVNSGFVLRMIGLFSAIIVCMLAILVVLPNINDPWGFALVLALALLPGAIATTSSPTVSLGLSYCMSVFFILTGPSHPSIDLAPLQERAVSVGAATILAWMVFMLVRPVYARERISHEICSAFTTISKSLRLAGTSDLQRVSLAEESDAHWSNYAAMDALNRMIADSRPEFAARADLLSNLNGLMDHLERIFVLTRFMMRSRVMYDGRALEEDHHATPELDLRVSGILHGYADLLPLLGRYSMGGPRPDAEFKALRASLQEVRAEVNQIPTDTTSRRDHLAMSQLVAIRLMDRELAAALKLMDLRASIDRNSAPIVVGESYQSQALVSGEA